MTKDLIEESVARAICRADGRGTCAFDDERSDVERCTEATCSMMAAARAAIAAHTAALAESLPKQLTEAIVAALSAVKTYEGPLRRAHAEWKAEQPANPEPTEAMIEAGQKAWALHESGGWMTERLVPAIWRAMVSALSAEGYVIVKREREDALRKIACFDDEAAGAYLNAHGSYAMFDEPGSVKLAREALDYAVTTAVPATPKDTP